MLPYEPLAERALAGIRLARASGRGVHVAWRESACSILRFRGRFLAGRPSIDGVPFLHELRRRLVEVAGDHLEAGGFGVELGRLEEGEEEV